VQCVSEGRRADREREAVLWGSRSIAIKERIVLINQRLTDLHDDITQAPEPPSTPPSTSDVTPLVCHSCPSFPTIRINDENSIPSLNKSMNNILDYNEQDNRYKYEDQVLKMQTKTERLGSKNSESLPSNVTKQRPTLSSLLESSEHLHAKKLVLESKEQWGQLQLQLGTPRGVKKFFLRMR
jgi:small-conductance mechanosensitive channel